MNNKTNDRVTTKQVAQYVVQNIAVTGTLVVFTTMSVVILPLAIGLEILSLFVPGENRRKRPVGSAP